MQPATRENAFKEQKEISFTCRLVQKEDLAALACLEALCFAGERWNERMLAEMLENPCANMFVLCAEYNGLTADTINAIARINGSNQTEWMRERRTSRICHK